MTRVWWVLPPGKLDWWLVPATRSGDVSAGDGLSKAWFASGDAGGVDLMAMWNVYLQYMQKVNSSLRGRMSRVDMTNKSGRRWQPGVDE